MQGAGMILQELSCRKDGASCQHAHVALDRRDSWSIVHCFLHKEMQRPSTAVPPRLWICRSRPLISCVCWPLTLLVPAPCWHVAFVSWQGPVAYHILAPWAPMCWVMSPSACACTLLACLCLGRAKYPVTSWRLGRRCVWCLCLPFLLCWYPGSACKLLLLPCFPPAWPRAGAVSYLGEVCWAAGNAVSGRRWLAGRQVKRHAVSWHAVRCGIWCVLRPIGLASGQAPAPQAHRRPLPGMPVCALCVFCEVRGMCSGWGVVTGQMAHTVEANLIPTLARGCVCATEGSVACPDRTLLGKGAVV
jgi:hypothetical protein